MDAATNSSAMLGRMLSLLADCFVAESARRLLTVDGRSADTGAGRSQTRRATIALLNINEPQRGELRQMLMDDGDWPED